MGGEVRDVKGAGLSSPLPSIIRRHPSTVERHSGAPHATHVNEPENSHDDDARLCAPEHASNFDNPRVSAFAAAPSLLSEPSL
jgi:hypothetical protein